MSIFGISDLHLSFGTDKPMEIFGWENHIERLTSNWKRVVKKTDTVVFPGDFSWALRIEDSLLDFKFLESLPGRKIFLKGNHDLWWVTMNKNLNFFSENDIKNIEFVYNNAVVAEDYAICGTRGWLLEGKETDKKIILREEGRLRRSLQSAVETGKKPLVFFHYPPVYAEEKCQELLNVLKEYDIKNIYYGHIHGAGRNNAITEYEGIRMKLISCDCIDFTPYLIV